MRVNIKTLTRVERNYLEGILKKVSKTTSVPIPILKSTSRYEVFRIARHLYFYIAKLYAPRMAYAKIGAMVNKDHATARRGAIVIMEDYTFKYKPVLDAIGAFKHLSRHYKKYYLVFEEPNLIELLHLNQKISIEIILEEYSTIKI